MVYLNSGWLKSSVLDEEVEGGIIYGYVTDTENDVQLQNYLEKQHREGALSVICKQYKKVAILTNMYVEEEERGGGIGATLLEDFMDNATFKGAEAIVLVADTLETNAFELVKWYESYDFTIINGERHACPVMLKKLVCGA